MFNGSYEDSSTWTCGIPVPGRSQSHYTNDSRTTDSVTGLPPSDLEFQVKANPTEQCVCLPSLKGAQYDFAQPVSQCRMFSNSQASTSRAVSIKFKDLCTVSVSEGSKKLTAERISAPNDSAPPRWKFQPGLPGHPTFREHPRHYHEHGGFKFLCGWWPTYISIAAGTFASAQSN